MLTINHFYMKQIRLKFNQKLYDCIEDYCLKYEVDEKDKAKMLLFTGLINVRTWSNKGYQWYQRVPLYVLNKIFEGDSDMFDRCLHTTIRIWSPPNRNWQSLSFTIYPELHQKTSFSIRLNISNELANVLNKWFPTIDESLQLS